MVSPVVSVVIPVYNGDDYFPTVLECVLNQTLDNIEIIIIDDCSTDNTNAYIGDVASRDPRVLAIRNDYSLGAGASRNIGLSQARGEYIIFLDDDDIIDVDMLLRLYDNAKLNDADVLVFGSEFINWNTKEVIDTPWTIRNDLLPVASIFSSCDIKKDFFHAFVWWPWDKFYNRERIIKRGLRFQEIRTSNDLLFTSTQMLLANRIAVLPNVLIQHSILRSGSLENTRFKSWECAFEALSGLKQFLVSHSLYEHRKNDYINYVLSFLKWNIDTISGAAFEPLFIQSRMFILDLNISESDVYESDLVNFLSDLISLQPVDYLLKSRTELYQKVNRLEPVLNKTLRRLNETSDSLVKSNESKANKENMIRSLNQENSLLEASLCSEVKKNMDTEVKLSNALNYIKSIEASKIWRGTKGLRSIRKWFL